MKKLKMPLVWALIYCLCLSLFAIPAFATAYNGTQVESGERDTETAIIEKTDAEMREELSNFASELLKETPTAVFDAATRTIKAENASSDATREYKRTYITNVDISAFANDRPINIILPQDQDSLIINVTGMEDYGQYKFFSKLTYNGKYAPTDNGRNQAGKVLLNLGSYVDGFLDFVFTDGVSVLAPMATVKYPMTRVEIIVMLGANGYLYSAEIPHGSEHKTERLETDVFASRKVQFTRDYTG